MLGLSKKSHLYLFIRSTAQRDGGGEYSYCVVRTEYCVYRFTAFVS